MGQGHHQAEARALAQGEEGPAPQNGADAHQLGHGLVLVPEHQGALLELSREGDTGVDGAGPAHARQGLAAGSHLDELDVHGLTEVLGHDQAGPCEHPEDPCPPLPSTVH